MQKGSIIESVTAREIFSGRGHPSVETTIITKNGAAGVAEATAGLSVGEHEVQFAYDGGERWGGLGVQKAVGFVNNIIGPALKGTDAANQFKIDEIIQELDGTPNKAKLGGNTTASVSAAALKAGAASLGIPLYQHIGGTAACLIPTPGVGILNTIAGYGGKAIHGDKPSYSFMTYGFHSFSEASYAAWQVHRKYLKLLEDKLKLTNLASYRTVIPPGTVNHESEIWKIMAEAIEQSGHTDKVGIQVDVAAATYYNKGKNLYQGLFSIIDKSSEDLIELYRDMVKQYPFICLEDPLDENDYEGHAVLTRELGIQVVGDDLFTTNVERLKLGMKTGACNTVLLKVNQIGTISEAFDTVRLAYANGYGVQPCASRGEGADIADYAVGLGTGTIRESALDPTGNRLRKIESELGSKARFAGKAGFKFGPALVKRTPATT
jgi:enolase